MDHSAYNTRPAESRLSLDNFEVFWPKVFYINYFLTLIISTNIILSRVSAAAGGRSNPSSHLVTVGFMLHSFQGHIHYSKN